MLMEPQHYQQQQQEDGTNIGSCVSGVGGSKASFLCRQSSTRWIPTSDQIRILRDLYYNNGLRSPNAEQIQRISARLRQYGKIEGKNVFYWFQNHKARERHKKRLTVDITTNNNNSSSSKSTAVVSPGFPTTGRSSGSYNVGQTGNDGYDGSVLAETSFREYCMAGGVSGSVSSVGWGGSDSATMPWTHHCHSDRVANTMSREIETLQLFPINLVKEEDENETEYYSVPHLHTKESSSSNENSKNQYIPNTYCYSGQQPEEQHQLYNLSGNAATYDLTADSLELTLNSYYAPPGST